MRRRLFGRPSVFCFLSRNSPRKFAEKSRRKVHLSYWNVMMKEKNPTAAAATTSIFKKVLLNCSAQAKVYGSCVAAKVPEVERDMCLKEFLELRSCMQSVLRRKC